MRYLILSVVWFCFFGPTLIAQGDSCDLDFTEAEAALEAARNADSVEDAIASMTFARLAITQQQKKCFGEVEELGTTRSNPVPFGESRSVSSRDDQYILRIEDVKELSSELVYEISYFEEEEVEPYRWIAVTIELFCDKSIDESCNVDPDDDWLLVGDDGVTYESEGFLFDNYPGTEEVEIFGGARVITNLIFPVDPDDTNFVLLPERTYDDLRIYFAVDG